LTQQLFALNQQSALPTTYLSQNWQLWGFSPSTQTQVYSNFIGAKLQQVSAAVSTVAITGFSPATSGPDDSKRTVLILSIVLPIILIGPLLIAIGLYVYRKSKAKVANGAASSPSATSP